jgi:hypothetical protein
MSSDSALLSAAFYEAGQEHLVELVHQRDEAGGRRLAALTLGVHAPDGTELSRADVDTRQETLDLGAACRAVMAGRPRVMAVLDARYDARVFPYRPHHYAWVRRPGSTAAPLYYAVNAALGGVPDRIGATGMNNYETYLFRRQAFDVRYALLLGNLGRFAGAEAQVTAFYEKARTSRQVAIAPRAHAEVELPPALGDERLTRVELKAVFRLASYVVGRRASGGDLVLLDHLFTYFR